MKTNQREQQRRRWLRLF